MSARRGKRAAYGGHFGDHLGGGRRPDALRFMCVLCEGGTDRLTGELWNVAAGQSVVEAQQAHHRTHPLVLREAVETLVRHLDSGVTIVVQPEARDPHDRMVTVVTRGGDA